MSKRKLIIGIIILMTIIFVSCIGGKQPVNVNPEIDGFIYDAETAIKIAEAVWLPIYGDEIYSHKPFTAELKDTVWVVTGHVKTKLGGAPYMMISKKNGRILEVSHEL